MADWQTMPLGNIANILTGKLDSNAAVEGGIYPYFTCSPETLAIDRYAFDCDAVLLAGNNANGNFCVKRFKGRFNAYQRTYVITAKDSGLLDVDFLFYFLTTLSARLTAFSSGTATKFLTRSILDPLQVPLPDIHEQIAIGSILRALDEKIELNRRMNETLETMARAIFKDWFVDFGPSRAKSEGQAPYLAADIWRLFPDRLDGEGKPEGWQNSSIGAEVEVVGGSTPSTKDASFWADGKHFWATPKDLSALSHPVLLHTERKITDAGVAVISSGLLPVGTMLLSSRAPIGYLAIAEVPTAINQGFIAMRCTGQISNLFALLWCRENMDAITANANGSTFQEISKTNFRPISLIRPSEAVLSAFEACCRPLYERLVANVREMGTLVALRDLLLPKLMSGEIRVKDAEKLVGEAA